MSLIDVHRLNTTQGPLFEAAGEGMEGDQAKIRLIAYYLPQFHPIPQNDAAWGKNFTEWTNVTRATPYFPGHYQPHLPGDLGFYDLRQFEAIRAQAELAKKFGVYGFCIHYYWFGGKPILETPLRVILDNKNLDIPFCINWANENWTRRWDGREQEVILRQDYSVEAELSFARSLEAVLSDPRYITVNGRPLIMIYRPTLFPDIRASLDRWKTYFVKSGFPEPYFVLPKAFDQLDPRPLGFDAMAGFPPHIYGHDLAIRRWFKLIYRRYKGAVREYSDLVDVALADRPTDYTLFPGICPSWDNTARRAENGSVLAGSTPEQYGAWLRSVGKWVLERYTGDEQIVFVNAWNEWAEGAHLEPDRHFGYAYLNETARSLRRL